MTTITRDVEEITSIDDIGVLFPPIEQVGHGLIHFAYAECSGPMRFDDGREYHYRAEMLGNVRVESKQTGKYIYISPHELVMLAIARGIDEPGEIPWPKEYSTDGVRQC